jgi:putative N6-adenine-specific DNA methylase
VASSRSALYHTGAVEERVREELGLVAPAAGATAGTADATPATAGVWVRVDRDGVVVSVDSSGDALHRRGWRTDAGRAPVRETLAAALVLWSGWNGRVPLLDPCCGAGTIAIEAALVAARRAPGRHRRFAFEAFPSFDAAAWERALAGADADVVDPPAVIAGSDVDPAMVALTRANATRAGVTVAVHTADVTSVASGCRSDPASWAARVLTGGRGVVVTNPPYGRRLTAGDPGLAGVYAAIGQLVPPAARLAVIAPRRAPTSAFGHTWADQVVLRNGGLPVRMLRSG